VHHTSSNRSNHATIPHTRFTALLLLLSSPDRIPSHLALSMPLLLFSFVVQVL
jgi:hypothetical protein